MGIKRQVTKLTCQIKARTTNRLPKYWEKRGGISHTHRFTSHPIQKLSGLSKLTLLL